MTETDRKLLQRYAGENDAAAFNQLSERYRGMVFAAARRVTGNHHDAEDVAQACFLELARRADQVNNSVAAYLHASATRKGSNVIRDQSRRKKYEKQAAAERIEAETDGDPAERSWEELAPEVDAAIEQLPEEVRIPLILHYLRGLSETQIAYELGIRRRTVRNRLTVGVRQLRAILARPGTIVPAAVLTIGFKASGAVMPPANLIATMGRMALAGAPRKSAVAISAREGSDVLRLFAAMGLISGIRAWLIGISAGVTIAGVVAWHLNSSHLSPSPYDRISQFYAQFDGADATAFSRHVALMKRSAADFWRGSQPLFFQWCKENCADWLEDPADSLVCTGNPHIQEVERSSGPVVDTNASVQLPVEIELLQGLIAVRLDADRGFGVESTSQSDPEVAHTLCETYRDVLLGRLHDSIPSQAGPTASDDALELNRYVDRTGQFRPLVSGRRGKTIEILRPTASPSISQATQLLTIAIKNNPKLGGEICGADASAGRWQVRSVCQRIRLNTVATQGETDYLMLVARDRGIPNLIVELNQQTASPAEMAGAVAPDPRDPAQRVAENTALLGGVGAFPVSWCRLGDISFTARIHQPGAESTMPEEERWQAPLTAAREWATTAAQTHLRQAERLAIAFRITPELESKLSARSDAFIQTLHAELDAFCADARVARDENLENAHLAQWVAQANQLIRRSRKGLR